jgi:hypothetical protein
MTRAAVWQMELNDPNLKPIVLRIQAIFEKEKNWSKKGGL